MNLQALVAWDCVKQLINWWVCLYHKNQERIVEKSVEGIELKEVIVHGLLHTVPRCLAHGKTWWSLARKMNDAYGYPLLEEKDEDAIFYKELPVLHKVACLWSLL